MIPPRPMLVFALLLITLTLGTHGASCIGYSKGAFTGDVTTKDICETACETAEGLPKPDFKTSVCTVENVTTILYDCDCLRTDNSGVALERRGLCDDGPCAGESRARDGSLLLLSGVLAVASVFLFA